MSRIDDLMEERRQLQLRIGVIDRAISEYHEWERRVELLLPTQGRNALRMDAGPTPPTTRDVAIATVTNALLSASQQAGAPKASSMEDFTDAVNDLLDQIDRPLQRTPLFEALEARGIVIDGKEPLNTLSARMTRMENVTNIKGFGFWRKDRPYAPADYVPEPTRRSGLDLIGESDLVDQASDEAYGHHEPEPEYEYHEHEHQPIDDDDDLL
jgi:hypothetical protein